MVANQRNSNAKQKQTVRTSSQSVKPPNLPPEQDSDGGIPWMDVLFGMFTITIGATGTFLLIIDRYSALTVPLSIVGICVATLALLTSIFVTRIDTRHQTIGLAFCVGVLSFNYFKAGGPTSAVADVSRVARGENPIGFIQFPQPEEKKNPDRFLVDAESVELTAARIEALIAELAIMDRINRNQLVTSERRSEFQKRLKESEGFQVRWEFYVQSIEEQGVYVREQDAEVEIMFGIGSNFSSHLTIGEHVTSDLARTLKANDTLIVSGNISSIEFRSGGIISLSDITVLKK